VIFEDEREVVVLLLTPAERRLIESALKRYGERDNGRLTANVLEMLRSSRWTPHDLKWLLATLSAEEERRT
jgi:hypothetical protein